MLLNIEKTCHVVDYISESVPSRITTGGNDVASFLDKIPIVKYINREL